MVHRDADLEAAIASVPALAGGNVSVVSIDEGRTNRNFRVETEGGAYFLRLSGKDTDLLGIDRTAEHMAALTAADAGIGPEVVAYLPEIGCLVTRWLPAEPLSEGDLEDPTVLAEVVRIVHAIHAGPEIPWTFDSFRIVEEYRRLSLERGVSVPDTYEEAHRTASRIEDSFAGIAWIRPCHNDLLTANLIRSDDRIWIVDHEYAGMGDVFFDLGNLSINNGLSEGAQETLLEQYFGEVTDTQRARLKLMRIMSDFREAMWGVVQQGISTLDVDYVEYADRHFRRLSTTMADDRFPDWLEAAADHP